MKGAFKLNIETIKGWLSLRGWEQRDLAAELNCDESLISHWIKGQKHPSWQALKKLCLLTGLDIGNLIYFDKDTEQEEDNEK